MQTHKQKEKKIFTKLNASSQTFTDTIEKANVAKKEAKKISVTLRGKKGIHDEVKNSLLPLLIEVYELRQILENRKLQKNSPLYIPHKSPNEILAHLLSLHKDIEEAQKWCDGITLQIKKAIKEAEDLLHEEKTSPHSFTTPWWKRLLQMVIFWRKLP